MVAAGIALALAATLGAGAASAQSLRGSQRSLDLQNLQARRHGFELLDTRQDIERLVASGALVQVEPNAHFYLKEVSFPYARPEVKLFLERLAAEYEPACGEQLVVTSLTRARRLQPRNASWRSVHPTGMAFDLRRSWSRRCRGWLEGVLLSLETDGVLEATLERTPPHYHIALFPEPYREFLAGLDEPSGDSEFLVTRYEVNRGDTLSKIARTHSTTVEQVKASNGLRSDRIYPGQVLVLPSRGR
jgi:nucleoid-associated protein YgaU